jgi:hypothetical protein
MATSDRPSLGRPLCAIRNRRQLLLAASGMALLGACSRGPGADSGPADKAAGDSDILAAMKRATRFMRERCTVNGGYVWAYADDFSRRGGEMEAFPGLIWIQPPGTATVGHLYLDCFHATGDGYFYEAAAEVADGLVAAQHSSGGWNYLHDFDGEASMRRWYDTIGRNGWRLEEFHHYYGNATFDDAGTSEASQFLLRMYLEKREQKYSGPLEKAVTFVLDSQYDNGGWPQRFPFVDDAPALHGRPDYTRHITFNDDVAGENIKFLLMVYQALADDRARAAIDRAMNIFPATLQSTPQAGWGLQHTADTLAPVGARSYEPDALVASATAGNVSLMLDFFEWTGERRFLERLPEVFTWLESVRLPASEVQMPGREYPTFIELGSNKALINHRHGSNVVNGAYYQDHESRKPIRHYSQWRAVDLDGLRKRYAQLAAAPSDPPANSPLRARADFRLPRLFSLQSIEVSDLNSNIGNRPIVRPDAQRIDELVGSLNGEGYWPTPLYATSNPYIGDGPEESAPGDYSETLVGDASDTSPYLTDTPDVGISTGSFIQNMSALMQAIDRGT